MEQEAKMGQGKTEAGEGSKQKLMDLSKKEE